MAISTPVTIGTFSPGTSSAGTIVLATTGTVAANGKLFAFLGWFSAAGTLSSVTAGGVTFDIHEQGITGSCAAALASGDFPSGLASGATIVATFSASVADRYAAAAYSTGVTSGAGAAYGTAGLGTDTNQLWTTGTITVASGDLMLGGCMWENGVTPTNTPTSGTTLHAVWSGTGGQAYVTEYLFGTGAAVATSGTWAPASGGPPSGTRATGKAFAAGTASAPTTGPPLIVNAGNRW